MKIKFVGHLGKTFQDFEYDCQTIRQVLSRIKFLYGEIAMGQILNCKIAYGLVKDGNTVFLRKETFHSDISAYDELVLIPEIAGETGIEIAFAVMAGIVLAAGLAMAFTMSNNRKTSNDQYVLKSNLFESAPIVTTEGTVVPLVYGSPYCGGVLISSGIYTSQAPFPGFYTSL